MPNGKVLGRPRLDFGNRMRQLCSRHLLDTPCCHIHCHVYLVLGRNLVGYAGSLVSGSMHALSCGYVFGAHGRVIPCNLHIVLSELGERKSLACVVPMRPGIRRRRQ